MMERRRLAGGVRRSLLGGVAVMAVISLVGCRVDTHKSGERENVKIATPFGGLSVKTNEADIQQGVGLSLYPGAVLTKKNEDHNDGAADVNMSFGNFHLSVKALSYKTGDAPEKVIDFYRKDMARYGSVIFCRDRKAIGTPTRTQDGLSCEEEHDHRMQVDIGGSAGELKAGSKQHQHIVSVDRDGSGTKLGLIAIELPESFPFSQESKSDEERDKQ